MGEREPNARGLTVAQDCARWFIGDPYWADLIVRAYLNPETAAAELLVEREGA
jgi:hypothetical protein